MMRGKVTAVDAKGVYVQTAEYGTLGPCQYTTPVGVGESVLVVDVGDEAAPDLIVVGRISKPGQIDQTKFYTSGPTQIIEVQGYNARIKSNDASSYLAVDYGGTFRLVGAALQVPAASGVELGSSGPTITVGTGAPSHTPPNGSIYLRTDGTASTTLYVRAAGAWSALS